MSEANLRISDTITSSLQSRVMRKLNIRIMAFVFLCFIVNYLDRVNLSFAALRMNADVGLTPEIFGFGAGIFFIGYMLFEVPSNLMLYRLGPRIWISRIMVTWGIVSCAMALIQGPKTFYIARFLLGLAEAGFVPGVLLYLTYWYPAKARGRASATFMIATVSSVIIGAPLSGWLISAADGLWGLHGWQAMFIFEGLPAVILGVIAFFYLTDKPEQAQKWLEPDERNWLINQLELERRDTTDVHHNFFGLFKDYRVWLLTAVYMFNNIAMYGVLMWLPQIVKSFGHLSNFQTGIISATPFLFAAAGLITIAKSSDRTGERKYHTAIASFIGGVFLALSALAGNPVLGLVLLWVCAFFMWAYLGVFWTMPPKFLRGAAAAGGIAAINGIAQIGGFFGPYIIGYVKGLTGSFSNSLIVLAVFPILASIICACLRLRRD